MTRIFGQPLFGVYVRPHTPAERDATWQQVTEYFRDVLRAPAA